MYHSLPSMLARHSTDEEGNAHNSNKTAGQDHIAGKA